MADVTLPVLQWGLPTPGLDTAQQNILSAFRDIQARALENEQRARDEAAIQSPYGQSLNQMLLSGDDGTPSTPLAPVTSAADLTRGIVGAGQQFGGQLGIGMPMPRVGVAPPSISPRPVPGALPANPMAAPQTPLAPMMQGNGVSVGIGPITGLTRVGQDGNVVQPQMASLGTPLQPSAVQSAAQAMLQAPPQAPRVFAGPQTVEQMNLLRQLAPYLTQRLSAKDAADARAQLENNKQQTRAQMTQVKLGIKLAEDAQKQTNDLLKYQARMFELRNKPQKTPDDLKFILQQQKMAGAAAMATEKNLSTLDINSIASSEPGSPERMNYEKLMAQRDQQRAIAQSWAELGGQQVLKRTGTQLPKGAPLPDFEKMPLDQLHKLAGS